MLYNELATPFPWYDKIELQVRYNDPAEMSIGNSIISYNDAILPFQFRRISTGEAPTSWKIYNCKNELVSDISDYISDIKAATIGEYDYFIFNTNTAMVMGDVTTLKLNPGTYYCILEFPDTDMYSEVFRVPVDSFSIGVISDCNYIKIDWKNTINIPPIYYSSISGVTYRNLVFLDAPITSSEPEIFVIAKKDGNGDDIRTFQRAIIKYRVTAVVPDFLKLALVLMEMHDTINITTERGLRTGVIKNLTTDSGVENGGVMSTVDLLFEQNLLMISKSCSNEMQLADCPANLTGDPFYAFPALPHTDVFAHPEDIPTYCYACDVDVVFADTSSVTVGQNVPIGQFLSDEGYQVETTDVVSIRVYPKSFNCDLGVFTIVL